MGAPRLLSLLEHTWTKQCRWIQLGGATLPEGQRAGSSLPQGCPAAPMGLTVLLKYPAMHLRRLLRDGVEQVIYLDDRNIVVTSARGAETVIQTWNRFSQELGLVENRRKLRVLTKDPAQRRALQNFGIEVHQTAKVWGASFFSNLEDDPELSDRAERTAMQVKRLRLLPIGETGRELMFRHSSILSFLRAEWFWRQKGITLPGGRWTQQINDDLEGLGFVKIGPWKWRHAGAGDVSWFQGAAKQELRKTGHVIREAWRQGQMRAFLRMTRHEAVEIQAQGATYREEQVTKTRRLYARATAEERGVLTAGTCSEANYGQKSAGCAMASPTSCSVASARPGKCQTGNMQLRDVRTSASADCIIRMILGREGWVGLRRMSRWRWRRSGCDVWPGFVRQNYDSALIAGQTRTLLKCQDVPMSMLVREAWGLASFRQACRQSSDQSQNMVNAFFSAVRTAWAAQCIGTVASYPWLNKCMAKTSHDKSMFKEVTKLQRHMGHDFALIPREVCVKEKRVRGSWGCLQCCQIYAHLATLRLAAANGYLELCRGHAEEKGLFNKRGNKLQQQLGAPRPRIAVRKLFLSASKDSQNKSHKDEAASSSQAAPPCMPSPSAERTKHAYCTCTDVPMTFDEQTELWTWKCSRCDVEFHGRESHKLEAQGRRHVRKHHAQAVNSPVAQKHRGKLCWPCTVCKCKITADTKARLKDRRRLRIDGFHPDCDVSQFLTLGGKPAGSQRPGPKRVKALLDAAKERLVTEGIEPNPGPSIRGGASPKEFQLDRVNVNSYINAANAVADLRKQNAKPNIFCMAEVKASNAQSTTIAAGGIMVAMFDTEACAVLDKWLHTQGEMIHFDLGHSFWAVALRRPIAERDQHETEVNTLKLYAASKASPWMIVGDQNDLP
ncbi:unnamed protein product, partial [Symbiodinium microadriaticum]